MPIAKNWGRSGIWGQMVRLYSEWNGKHTFADLFVSWCRRIRKFALTKSEHWLLKNERNLPESEQSMLILEYFPAFGNFYQKVYLQSCHMVDIVYNELRSDENPVVKGNDWFYAKFLQSCSCRSISWFFSRSFNARDVFVKRNGRNFFVFHEIAVIEECFFRKTIIVHDANTS